MLIPCVHVEITWLMNSWILQLKDSNFTRLCSTKSMLTVNESFPGPTIRVRKGDTAIVNVHNYGRYGVTIHWSCLALSHITSYFFNLSHEVRFCWIQLDIWFFFYNHLRKNTYNNVKNYNMNPKLYCDSFIIQLIIYC